MSRPQTWSHRGGFGHERFLMPVVVIAVTASILIPEAMAALGRARDSGGSFWSELWVGMTGQWLVMVSGVVLALTLLALLWLPLYFAWLRFRERRRKEG